MILSFSIKLIYNTIMALKKVDFAAGFNKQGVPSALPGKWVDGDFVRFR